MVSKLIYIVKIKILWNYPKVFLNISKESVHKQSNLCGSGCVNDVHESSVGLSFFEFYDAICECEQGEISSNSDVLAGVVFGAALTKDNVSCNSRLATKNFHTESFTLRVTAVLYTAFAFFMCHLK